MSIELLLP